MFYAGYAYLMAEADRVARMSPERRAVYMRAQKLQRLKDKDERMNRRLQRHREQMWKRNWMIVGQGVFWLCIPFLAIAAVVAIWRFCAWVVFT